jgi:Holliday junction resolvase RusA-like endonuclease
VRDCQARADVGVEIVHKAAVSEMQTQLDAAPSEEEGVAVQEKIEITLPLPPKEMCPNARKHWRAKMKPKKKQREDAFHAARYRLMCSREFMNGPPRWRFAECQATFYMPRRRDGDNLIAWLKATFDGLQDAGIIENDGNFIHLPPKQITAKAANGERKVVLVITERRAAI